MMETKVPESWIQCNLGDVINYKKGKKPQKIEDVPFEDSIPYLDIQAFEFGDYRRFADKKSSNVLDANSVAIVWDGARSGWVSKGVNGALGSTLAAITPVCFSNDYLFYYLKSQFEFINTNTRGIGIPHVDPNIIWNLPFPLPPLAEQARIVAKLDALFAHTDTLKAKLDRIPALLKDFRQQVLTQAITGKLTEEWRKGNGTSIIDLIKLEKTRENLKKRNAHVRGQKSFKYVKSVNIDIKGRSKGIDTLFELPDNWEWVSIDQVIWNVSDGPHFSPNYVEEETGKKFISARNISYKGIDFNDCKYVSIEDHLKFIQRGKPENGDIILTKGGTTGITCLVEGDIDFSYWVHLALLKPIKDFVIPQYLRDALSSQLLYRQSQELTHGVGNQDLGLTRLIYIAMPLPPLEEQQEIVRRVEGLFKLADSIEARYHGLKDKIDTLPQAILNKAFKGELVPQNPAEEPASVLLERIRKEKGKATK